MKFQRLWKGMLMLAMAIGGTAGTSHAASWWAYIGTYTQGDSRGIYAASFDSDSGKFGDAQLVAETTNPSFLAIHPSGDYLYAVGETGQFEGRETGFVRAFRIDRSSGKLSALNAQVSSGTGPCHLVVDAAGKAVLVANYGSGSVSSISIRDDGSLGDVLSVEQHVGSSANAQRQEGPHAHSINLDAANRFAYAADLGLDKVLIYHYDAATGKLSRQDSPPSASVAPGSGPRHFAFNPSAPFAYVINELSSTLVAFRHDPQTGALETLQEVSTLPDDYDQPSHTAEVVVHPSGKFVYGSNRGHDSIAVFQTQPQTGRLTRVQIEATQGKTPRNFVVDPSGQFLLAENQGSNTVVVFRIDDQSGRLTGTGEVLQVPMPVCIRWVPSE
jgi:6-phosphogluconolactonase